MAETTARQTGKRRQPAPQAIKAWRGPVNVIGGCVLALIFALLHVRFGATTPARALATAVASTAIFLVTYFIFRRIEPRQRENPLAALLISVVVALPVFILAFFGLGYEIPEFADFGAMYILGAWMGSAEAMENALSRES